MIRSHTILWALYRYRQAWFVSNCTTLSAPLCLSRSIYIWFNELTYFIVMWFEHGHMIFDEFCKYTRSFNQTYLLFQTKMSRFEYERERKGEREREYNNNQRKMYLCSKWLENQQIQIISYGNIECDSSYKSETTKWKHNNTLWSHLNFFVRRQTFLSFCYML